MHLKYLPAATKLWPRLCFYTCLWFCSQGGSPGRENPPGRKNPPPQAGRLPLDQADPPGQGEPPQTRQTPPGPGRHPPPGKQTPEYGLRAAGMHPTGMHSCPLFFHSFLDFVSFGARLYWLESKSESGIASRWVHKESNLMFKLTTLI